MCFPENKGWVQGDLKLIRR